MTGIAQVQKLITSVLGSRFQRELKQLRPIVEATHRHEAALQSLSNEALQQQTAVLRARIAERTGALAGEVDRLKTAKHACADPDERDRLDRELVVAERELRITTAKLLDEPRPEKAGRSAMVLM